MRSCIPAWSGNHSAQSDGCRNAVARKRSQASAVTCDVLPQCAQARLATPRSPRQPGQTQGSNFAMSNGLRARLVGCSTRSVINLPWCCARAAPGISIGPTLSVRSRRRIPPNRAADRRSRRPQEVLASRLFPSIAPSRVEPAGQPACRSLPMHVSEVQSECDRLGGGSSYHVGAFFTDHDCGSIRVTGDDCRHD